MGDLLYMYENLHLFKNSEAYRRAFVEQSGKGVNDVQNPSPVAESYTSSYASYAVAPPKQRSRGTYVQRWKVLRDRNKSLPKLDFNVKASGVPKKFQGAGSFSRSHTYDSMKLPSLSTCSVITGVSGKSVHSDGYKKKEDKTIQEQHSESYNDLSTLRDYREVKAYLSKSLQSLNQDDKKSPQQKSQQKEDSKNKNSHRYENITYKKHLLKRHLGNNVADNSKRSKEGNAQFKMDREKTQLKTKVQREIVYVKDHTKELPKLLTNDTHENKNSSIYPKGNIADLNVLQQSGIYQIDLSEVRNEIPPVQHEPFPPISSAQTERGYRTRKLQRITRSGRGTTVDKKWRDGCDCLRCDIIRRQFAEGDMNSYKNWGNYPCMKLAKSRSSTDTFFYDSD